MTRVCVTGATGYVGSRLVPKLLEHGYDVSCLVRDPDKLVPTDWADDVHIVAGDLRSPSALAAALQDCSVAYYLVHGIGSGPGWAAEDLRTAEAFRRSSAAAGVEQIVYLGGLGDARSRLSEHLRSRHEVGAELAAGDVAVTELRAAVVIGSGSASFEILRHLVEKLPIMVTPRWVRTRCQPIGIDDLLSYLIDVVGCIDAKNRVFEIGGPDVMTYEQMMRTYASVTGLPRRLILPVPVLSPRLSSLWIGLVTPLPPALARPLIDSLTTEVVVRDGSIRSIVPMELASYPESVRRATATVRGEPGKREQHSADPGLLDPPWSGGKLYVDRQAVLVDADASSVYRVLSQIGGDRGRFSYDILWKLRGGIDRLVGGPGLRRHRGPRPPLVIGGELDFWRIDATEHERTLRLRAEMKMPGRAWLEWHIEPHGAGSMLRQAASFVPSGLFGRLYWRALAPVHRLVFARMCHGIAEAASRHERD